MHCGKLLHEGAPVTRGIRLILVGFVDVSAPQIDSEFLAGKMANASKRSVAVDYECATRAFRQSARSAPTDTGAGLQAGGGGGVSEAGAVAVARPSQETARPRGVAGE